MMNRIEFIQTEHSTRQVIREDRWEFYPSGYLAGILRAAFRWAIKRGHFKNAIDDVVTYQRHVVDTDDMLERLFLQKHEAMKHLSRRNAVVLMGSDDYQELTGNPAAMQYLELPTAARDGHGVFGMTIRVVPWMRGVVVVPA